MNQTQAAQEIASRLNRTEGTRARVKTGAAGVAIVSCELHCGGKKGWLPAGEIRVGREIEVSKEATFAFRYSKDQLNAALSGIDYSFESPEVQTEGEEKAKQMRSAAAAFRAGRPVSDSLVVECVAHGYLSQSEAMNRDL